MIGAKKKPTLRVKNFTGPKKYRKYRSKNVTSKDALF
jgi:hypothetical protein